MDFARNNLGQETSPYLLQHQDNPVHWQPWCPETFAYAKEHNKPVLLSIGYAACHWCHVMAHESFENPEIANVMNELYVNIKLDREERPDIDMLYQNTLSLLGQQGGWPLTMFLTPQGQPFWGGTYFPDKPRFGRPGFVDVLTTLAAAYNQKPGDITQNITKITEALSILNRDKNGPVPENDLIINYGQNLLQLMDMEKGGTNGAPKFPQPVLLEFMYQCGIEGDNPHLRHIVTHSLRQMCQGGIYDHIGGGFARYSVDENWLVPHFEKMLYDNALLIDLMATIYQQNPLPLFKTRIEETIDWLLRDMRVEDAGFTASFDADSEGVEGKYYVWTETEIDQILGKESTIFKKYYDVSPVGNWEDKNILNRSSSGLDLGSDSTEETLVRLREKLFKERQKRILPGWDDKVLTDWNGLVIKALCHAASVFNRADWLDASIKAYDFILAKLSNQSTLLHSYRNNTAQHAGMLDDYANMINASLLLFEHTGQNRFLMDAENWIKTVNEQFCDDQGNGGYFQTSSLHADLIMRQKPVTDNAVPSGNGIMVQNLAKLYALTGKTDYRDKAEQCLGNFSGKLPREFPNMPSLLLGAFSLQNPVQIVLLGHIDHPEFHKLHQKSLAISSPGRAILCLASASDLPENHPAFGKSMVGNRPTAYICQSAVCSAPITDINDFPKDL